MRRLALVACMLMVAGCGGGSDPEPEDAGQREPETTRQAWAAAAREACAEHSSKIDAAGREGFQVKTQADLERVGRRMAAAWDAYSADLEAIRAPDSDVLVERYIGQIREMAELVEQMRQAAGAENFDTVEDLAQKVGKANDWKPLEARLEACPA